MTYFIFNFCIIFKTQHLFYTFSTPQLELATFQALSSHRWLIATILDCPDSSLVSPKVSVLRFWSPLYIETSREDSGSTANKVFWVLSQEISSQWWPVMNPPWPQKDKALEPQGAQLYNCDVLPGSKAVQGSSLPAFPSLTIRGSWSSPKRTTLSVNDLNGSVSMIFLESCWKEECKITIPF